MRAPVAARHTSLERQLSTLALVFILFFNTSGGAFTMEGLVARVGPGLALIMLAVVPLVWTLPETLIIAELGSMLPEEGGYYRWVRRAFGPFWAFQNGWATWLYSLVDMAIYPVLFNQYLQWFLPGLGGPAKWGVSLAVIWGATAINLRGALPVGRVSVFSGAFILAAFAALAAFSLPNLHHTPWVPLVPPGMSLSSGVAVGLATALWNYSGWDNASTVLGETKDASRAYPRAMFFAVLTVMASYFVPLIPALGATDWTTWSEGSWPAIAARSAGAAGPFIASWIALAGLVSALALFNALLLTYSRIPLAMAQDGLLPSALAETDARGTPRRAVLVAGAFYSVFALFPFGQLVVADFLLYAAALFLEFGALVVLRIREPGLRGVFRIPMGVKGVIALTVSPSLVLLLVIWLSAHDGEFALPSLIGSAIGLAVGPLVYYALTRRKP